MKTKDKKASELLQTEFNRAIIPFTEEQLEAINADKGNILVSAAAGSGKTTMMTERIVRRLVDGEINLQQTLILTFTNAASHDMAAEIEANLNRYKEASLNLGDPDITRRINNAIAYIPAAHIETIHAFCLALLKTFPEEVVNSAGEEILDADFATADENLSSELLEKALDNALEHFYIELEQKSKSQEAADKEFVKTALSLIEVYSQGRDDSNLRALLKYLYGKLRSMPYYRAEVSRLIKELEHNIDNFGASPHIRYLLSGLELRTDLALSGLAEMESRLSDADLVLAGKKAKVTHADYVNIYTNIFALVREVESIITACRQAEAEGEKVDYTKVWDDIYNLKEKVTYAKPRRGGKSVGSELKDEYIDCLDTYLSDFLYYLDVDSSSSLKDLCRFPAVKVWTMDSKAICAYSKEMLPLIKALFGLVLDLDSEYASLKARRNVIDFSDYEHFALQIMQTEAGRKYCQEQFKEVYIDEYQDTSSLEEAVLHQIAPHNTFMVGDVKQSIYRFRNARPEIFLAKADSFINSDEGKYLLLSKNFRSEAGILKGINEIFGRIMTAGLTGIDYQDGHQMVPGKQQTALDNRIEIMLNVHGKADADFFATAAEEVEQEKFDPESGFNSAAKTPRTAKAVIKALENSKLGVFQTKNWLDLPAEQKFIFHIAREVLRLHEDQNVKYKDIAILSRSNAKCNDVADIFRQIGIPVNRQVGSSVNDNYILQNQLALLKSLDNGKDDISLATLMLSNLLEENFNEEELLEIRIYQQENGKTGDFYAAVKYLATDELKPGDEFYNLHLKLSMFWEHYNYWRLRASEVSKATLLAEIWNKVDYQDLMIKQEGAQAAEVLEDFLTEVRELDKHGDLSLSQLIYALENNINSENSKSNDNDFNGDGVNIVTFHKSKGLDFQYVFIYDLDKTLRNQDNSNKVILSENLGIAFDVAQFNETGVATFPSHYKLALAIQEQERYLTEEICLLYVAMSRAKTKVYLCADFAADSKYKHLSALLKIAQNYPHDLPDYLLANISTYQEMILLALYNHPDADLHKFIEAYTDPENSNLAKDMQASNWCLHSYNNSEDLLEVWKCFLNFWAEQEQTQQNLQAETADVLTEATRLKIENFYNYRADQAFTALPKISISEIKRRSDLEKNRDQDEEELLANGNLLNSFPPANYGRTDNSFIAASKSNKNSAENNKSVQLNSEPRNINQKLKSVEDLELEPNNSAAVLSPTESGIALHTTFRFLDIYKIRNTKDQRAEILTEIDQLEKFNFLTAAEARAVRAFSQEILEFVHSDLAADLYNLQEQSIITGSVVKIYRELPFTFKYKKGEDKALVQGIIDLWYQGQKGPILVDYKSDYLPEDFYEAKHILLDRYKTQLEVYARALEQSSQQKVEKILIWSIRLARDFEFSRSEIGLEI